MLVPLLRHRADVIYALLSTEAMPLDATIFTASRKVGLVISETIRKLKKIKRGSLHQIPN
jgi:hypothetical protein